MLGRGANSGGVCTYLSLCGLNEKQKFKFKKIIVISSRLDSIKLTKYDRHSSNMIAENAYSKFYFLILSYLCLVMALSRPTLA